MKNKGDSNIAIIGAVSLQSGEMRQRSNLKLVTNCQFTTSTMAI